MFKRDNKKLILLIILLLFSTSVIINVNVYNVSANDSGIYGYTVKQPVSVYRSTNKNSEVLRQYNYNRKIKYYPHSENWYRMNVYIDGVAYRGYIHKDDVSTTKDTKSIRGIAINKLNIYSNPKSNSKILKKYAQGSVLKFRNYNDNWYKATVYVRGKKHTGYIRHKDVELAVHNQTRLTGLAKKHKTNIYTRASKSSKVIKKYSYGKKLKYRSFSKDWYEATVYVNGKKQTGYISKNDVSKKLNKLQSGYAKRNTVNVYTSTSKKSKVLKKYKYGRSLKYRYYNSNWYVTSVYVKGKKTIGFIHASDTASSVKKLTGYATKNKVNVYSSASKKAKVLKSYKKGSVIKYLPHNNSWHKVVVYVKGKKQSGFIHTSDIGDKIVNQNPKSTEKGLSIPILMYHQVGNNPSKDAYGRFVTPENFRKQVEFLKNNGYTLINFEDIPKAHKIKKPIIITFDDGREDNMIAFDILKEFQDEQFHPKATFFIIGSKIDKMGYLSEADIKEISNSNIISIQSHTMNHVHFNDTETKGYDLKEELSVNKQLLENITGKKVNTLAYPYGAYNQAIINETKKYYDYAVTTRHKAANLNGDLYQLDRLRVRFDTSIKDFEKMIK